MRTNIVWDCCSSSPLPPVPMFYIHLHSLHYTAVSFPAVLPFVIHTLSMDTIPQCTGRFPIQEKEQKLFLAAGRVTHWKHFKNTEVLRNGGNHSWGSHRQLADLWNYSNRKSPPLLPRHSYAAFNLLLTLFTPKNNNTAPAVSF